MENLLFYYFISHKNNKICIDDFLDKDENAKYTIIDCDYDVIRNYFENQKGFSVNQREAISKKKIASIIKNLKEKISTESFVDEKKLKAYYYTILKNYVVEDFKESQNIKFNDSIKRIQIDQDEENDISENLDTMDNNNNDNAYYINDDNISIDFLDKKKQDKLNESFEINTLEKEAYNIQNDPMYDSIYKLIFNEFGISQLSNRYILKTLYNK